MIKKIFCMQLIVLVLFLNTISLASTNIEFRTSNGVIHEVTLASDFDLYKYICIFEYINSIGKSSIAVFVSKNPLTATKTDTNNKFEVNCFDENSKKVSFLGTWVAFENSNTLYRNVCSSFYGFYYGSGDSSFVKSLYLSHDIKDNKGNVLISKTVSSTQEQENQDYVSNLLNTNQESLENATNSIENEDYYNKLENNDTSDIVNVPSSLSGAFKNIFSIFDFVGKVKDCFFEVFKMINTASSNYEYGGGSGGGVGNDGLNMTFNSKYVNGTYRIVDLSWYNPYKPLADTVICGFAYVGFAYHMFIKLSSIIRGAGSAYSVYSDNKSINYELTGKE